MAEEIRRLRGQLELAEAWSTEQQRYQLTALQPGIFAYALKKAAAGVEPPHWVCARCFNAGTKFVLQNQGDFYGSSEHLCNGCNSTLKLSSRLLPEF